MSSIDLTAATTAAAQATAPATADSTVTTATTSAPTGHIAVTHGAGRRSAGRAPFDLAIGDSFRVTGAPIGCRVVQRLGAKTIDCRVAGSLTGSYGTLMTPTRVLVVRFPSAHVAKEVFSATQHGGSGGCR